MADRCPIIEGPLPINAPVKNFSKFPYLSFFFTLPSEIACHRKNTGHEYAGINRRQFTLQGSAAGLHIEKMVVEPFISRGSLFRTLMAGMKETQKRQGQIGRASCRE